MIRSVAILGSLRARTLALALGLSALALLLGSLLAPASANAASSWWSLEARPAPTVLQPGTVGQLVLSTTDVGTEEADGATKPIVITDTLPKGLKVNKASLKKAYNGPVPEPCAVTPGGETTGETITCTFEHTIPAFEVLEVRVELSVETGAATGTNVMHVTGGGVPEQTIERQLQVGSSPAGFGIERYALAPENEGGSRDNQAGSHPFQLMTTLNFNLGFEENEKTKEKLASAPALVRDLQVKLPPGLVGTADPEAIPQCSDSDFATIEPNGITTAAPPTRRSASRWCSSTNRCSSSRPTVSCPCSASSRRRASPPASGSRSSKCP